MLLLATVSIWLVIDVGTIVWLDGNKFLFDGVVEATEIEVAVIEMPFVKLDEDREFLLFLRGELYR